MTLFDPDAGAPGVDAPAPDADAETESLPSADQLSGPIEALLLMAESPLPTAELAASLQAPVPVVEECLAELRRFYDETRRGFELRKVGGGWRLWTRPEHAEVLARAVLEGQSARLSQAAMETLAVVAYLQPVSRSRVAAVRGVNVDGVMRTLASRNLVTETVAAAGVGQAALFGTTDHFLERMGMSGLSELPALAPYLPEATDLEAELGRLAATDATTASPAPTEPADSAPTSAEIDEGANNEGSIDQDGPVTPTSSEDSDE